MSTFRFRTILLLLVFYSALFIHGKAQIKELRFTNISTNDGLSDNIINCIAQDNKGFMWFGTNEGLNRYNGYSNKIFKRKLGDSTSIPDNKIYEIYIDHQNVIWIGTHNGLCRYNPEKENFTLVRYPQAWYKFRIDNRVSRIEENSDKELFIASEAGFLFHYNREKSILERDTNDFHSIKTFIIDKEDRFWVGGIQGLFLYDKKSNKVTYFNSFIENKIKYELSEIRTIFEEGDTIWLGTIKGRILYILKNEMKVRSFEHKYIDAYFIYDIYKSSDNLLYFSTTSGLFIYDKKKGQSVSYTYNSSDPEGIGGIGITKVFEDIQKNLWVGSYQGGINFAVSEKEFTNYNQFSKKIKLDISNINAICEDNKSNLWLGSFDSGINVINPKTNERKLFLNDPNNPTSLGSGTVQTIFCDRKNNIWVGTYLGFLQKYNPVDETFTTVDMSHIDPRPNFCRDIRSIKQDVEGNLWLISHGHGLVKYNPETRKGKLFQHNVQDPEHSLADNWSFYILIDHEGMLWIATPNGLSLFNPLTEKFINYYNKPADSTTLGNNYLNTLFEDSYNNIWIGTSFGLDMFDRRTRQFLHFYEKDGLSNNQVNSIIEYKPGNIWISTNKGLSNLRYSILPDDKLKIQFRNYNKLDNLQDNLFWRSSVIKSRDENIVFGGERGIVVFNPERIKDNKIKPKVYITGLKLFNKEVEIGDYDSILRKNILSTNEITLKYNQNYFTLDFVAINYIAQKNCKYKFKMEGFDNDWIITDKLEATYTNLDPGQYVFKVTAANNDGYWNTEGVSITIFILPPYWQTWWFRSIIAMVIIAIGLSFYLFKINLLREQNIILEKRVLKRTQELSNLNSELVKKNERILSQSAEIQIKNEEINTQKEDIEEQKNKVEKAYEELSLYRNKLEELVEERTKELILAKEKAEESDKLKTSFLSNLSHEIRTPLNSIVGFSNIVFDVGLSDEEKMEYKKLVEESCFSLLTLINDIIDYSKIETGDIILDINEISIFQIVENTKEIFHFEHTKQNFYKKKNLAFRLNIPQQLLQLMIRTDEQRLKQILANLISNAIKFTMEGYVEFGCNFLNNSQIIEFYIKDTGIGIKKEDHEIIFQRFRKIESDSMDLFRGTGIGLSITQQLVKILGGLIRLESELNKGTTFYISFPVKSFMPSGKLMGNVSMTDTIPSLSNKTILIAEDDTGNFIYLEKVLRKSEVKILHAVNGKEAVEIYEQNPDIDLILMDIKMPVMNGIEAMKEIKKRNSILPIVAQTAYAFSDEIIKIREAGFTDYIAKPIISRDLYAIIMKHL